MKKELTEEELLQNPSIDMMFRRVKYEDLMKDVENYANEGKSIEEVNRLFFEEGNPNNKKVICSQDIYDYYVEHGLIKEEKKKTENCEELYELVNEIKKLEYEKKEESQDNESNSSEAYLTDEELEDYPDQPFKPYIEEDMVDEGRIDVSAGEKLSYLNKKDQQPLVKILKINEKIKIFGNIVKKLRDMSEKEDRNYDFNFNFNFNFKFKFNFNFKFKFNFKFNFKFKFKLINIIKKIIKKIWYNI